MKLRFFNEERLKLIKELWEEFCKKWEKKNAKASKVYVRKVVEQRSKEERGLERLGFSGQRSPVVDEAKWSRFWSWRRVLEREWQLSYEERYEQMVKDIKI